MITYPTLAVPHFAGRLLQPSTGNETMQHPLSTRDLIARMTPTALAEMIASIKQVRDGNLNAEELVTLIALETELANNVGDAEAAELIAVAQG